MVDVFSILQEDTETRLFTGNKVVQALRLEIRFAPVVVLHRPNIVVLGDLIVIVEVGSGRRKPIDIPAHAILEGGQLFEGSARYEDYGCISGMEMLWMLGHVIDEERTAFAWGVLKDTR